MSLCHTLHGGLSHSLSFELLNYEEHEAKEKEEN